MTQVVHCRALRARAQGGADNDNETGTFVKMALTNEQRIHRLQKRLAELDLWTGGSQCRLGRGPSTAAACPGAPWPNARGHRPVPPIGITVPDDWPLAETRLELDLGGEGLAAPYRCRRPKRRLWPRPVPLPVLVDGRHFFGGCRMRRAASVRRAESRPAPCAWRGWSGRHESRGIHSTVNANGRDCHRARRPRGRRPPTFRVENRHLGSSTGRRRPQPIRPCGAGHRNAAHLGAAGRPVGRAGRARRGCACLRFCGNRFAADGSAWLRGRFPQSGALAITGHAHIDLAWLWPLDETRRKAIRTFHTMVELMDRYSDLPLQPVDRAATMRCSRKTIRRCFERIKEKVARRPVGADRRDVGRAGHQHADRRILRPPAPLWHRYFDKDVWPPPRP